MFTDEKTLNVIHANLNDDVIHGTMRAYDLIPTFLDVIQETPEYEQLMSTPLVKYLLDLVLIDQDDKNEIWASDEVSYLLNEELFDVLNSYAPDGYYFGSHIGDGSAYGYWKIEDEE